jgi:CheY-like chemotaxis protein
MIKVLCVDDEAGMLQLVREFLEGSGDILVDTATSAMEAQKKMTLVRYDAIVSDYMMPETDGLQYLRMVRERDRDIPFILFTGRGREDIVIEALNSGVTFYLQKGDDLDSQFVELEHKIKQAVERRQALEELWIKRNQAYLAMDLAKIASWEFDIETGMFEFDDLFFFLYGTDALHEGGYVLSPETYITKFIHPDDRERVATWIQRGPDVIGPQGYDQIEHRIIRKDGEVRWIIVRLGMLRDPYGQQIKVYGVNQDITEQKVAEEKNKKLGRDPDRLNGKNELPEKSN